MGYANGQPLTNGVSLTISGVPLVGENIGIEYPNNVRDSAKIIAVSQNQVTISIKEKILRLTPKELPKAGHKPLSVWTIAD